MNEISVISRPQRAAPLSPPPEEAAEGAICDPGNGPSPAAVSAPLIAQLPEQ